MTLARMSFSKVGTAGMSDDQLVQELRAEQRLKEAVEEMRRAIADVNKTSALVEIEPSAFDDFLSDEVPDHDYWAEKLSIARQKD